MGDVINLDDKRQESVPHLSGEAICFKCKYNWVGVCPLGTDVVVCPECSCDGYMVGTVITDDMQSQCKCGCFVFRKDTVGIYCPNCGTRHDTYD